MKGIPPRLRGTVPKGFAHSIWQVVEHLRIAQADILEFCRQPEVCPREEVAGRLLAGHARAGSAAAWTKCASPLPPRSQGDAAAGDEPAIDLFAKIPHGSGQTYMREMLLVADHAAYHIAQIVDIRRALGNWQ